MKNVVLVDEGAALSLTSDKSTECYRNFWPGPGNAMVNLMNRSIDIMEALARESGNIFHLSRRGYVYATADPSKIPHFKRVAEESAGWELVRCALIRVNPAIFLTFLHLNQASKIIQPV